MRLSLTHSTTQSVVLITSEDLVQKHGRICFGYIHGPGTASDKILDDDGLDCGRCPLGKQKLCEVLMCAKPRGPLIGH